MDGNNIHKSWLTKNKVVPLRYKWTRYVYDDKGYS